MSTLTDFKEGLKKDLEFQGSYRFVDWGVTDGYDLYYYIDWLELNKAIDAFCEEFKKGRK